MLQLLWSAAAASALVVGVPPAKSLSPAGAPHQWRGQNSIRYQTPALALVHGLCVKGKAELRSGEARMGLFDAIAGAFANEEFKEDDQRVRASHILIKGDDDVEKCVELLSEIGGLVQSDPVSGHVALPRERVQPPLAAATAAVQPVLKGARSSPLPLAGRLSSYFCRRGAPR